MTKKKRGLGKGLAALIPDEPLHNIENDSENRVINIDVSLIQPSKEQPRRKFTLDSLNELAESIKVHGLIQPIIVRKIDDRYEVVAGERRLRAAKIAGFKQIPCIVKDFENRKSAEVALVENIQRKDLNPIEEAIAYKRLMENYNLTQDEISIVVGKSRPYITNTLRLLNLSQQVIDFILENKLTSGHGRALLQINDSNIQIKIAKEIIEKKLSVRETEKLIKELKKDGKRKKKNKNETEKDIFILDVEEQLRKILGTKVQIVKGKKKGKIEIEYYNQDDLDRILDIILNS
ncbi:chromosome partitioning protein, ParB family [Caloranaerobacter azorensis DSM 13643]|uniref:Chromosome partitioning protein, ParB family n=1 Tax=Caloranaerobacter azorensis DSM 13643 TaxID=1121264 RepID=A0A1M5VPL2_9FIRM|nr:ParB/RepB/Spo0J family partition protein [Caloranaerobacter azorensis]SHH77221.1 chromosome partitioning protein, ParB family [Caloranaerobacter azorensis DSM 13643]